MEVEDISSDKTPGIINIEIPKIGAEDNQGMALKIGQTHQKASHICIFGDCEKFSKQMEYPIIPCDLCGSQDGLQRQQVKKIIDGWEKNSPGRRQVIFRSLMNTKPSHLLDTNLFDFLGLQRELIDEHKIQFDPKIRDIVE